MMINRVPIQRPRSLKCHTQITVEFPLIHIMWMLRSVKLCLDERGMTKMENYANVLPSTHPYMTLQFHIAVCMAFVQTAEKYIIEWVSPSSGVLPLVHYALQKI